eukprot:TRINITY_DN15894_c1_g1_i2.p1 TRINITY_DN15894_c1_g1~~TRINITY_DN15894_c1_g1_i2.p1  ORF type:complete len:211 (+),score=67.79 TRINITY_DN15894_c1_g1_i2:79-711(+)
MNSLSSGGLDKNNPTRPENVKSTDEHKKKDLKDDKLYENGNPTSQNNNNSGNNSGVFPIIEPNIRPFSIYRHTPVFTRQKLTVPSLPQWEQIRPSINHSSSVAEKTTKTNKKRRKKDEERNVKKSEDIEGFRGNEDMDSILQFLGEESTNRSGKNNRKSADSKGQGGGSADLKENNKKKGDRKENKETNKKEKSVDKDSVSNKLSRLSLD